METYTATAKGPLKIPGYIDPDDVTVVTVFWGAPVFQTDTIYRDGDICRPTVDNGFYYKCTTNGKTASTEPATWAQSTQTSGTVKFTAVPYDLWLLPAETISASTWSATKLVTLSDPLNDNTTTSTVISVIPDGVTEFEVTNQVTKSNGEKLSRTFKYKVHEQ